MVFTFLSSECPAVVFINTSPGLTLNDPKKNDAVIAGAAKKVLGDSLDAMLLGNVSLLHYVHRRTSLKCGFFRNPTCTPHTTRDRTWPITPSKIILE